MSDPNHEPTPENLQRIALERLAATFGGQFAVRLATVQEVEQAQQVETSIISQRQLAAEADSTTERLLSLGQLATGSERKQQHYFAR